MCYQRYSFTTALAAVETTARYCARFVDSPGVKLLRYESGFIDDPATLDLIAACCGGSLAVADRTRIFADTRRPVIEAFIARLNTLPTAVHRVRRRGGHRKPVA